MLSLMRSVWNIPCCSPAPNPISNLEELTSRPDPSPSPCSPASDSFGTSNFVLDGSEVLKDALGEFLLPDPGRRLPRAENEVWYRLVSVHNSKEQSETLFQLISEGTY